MLDRMFILRKFKKDNKMIKFIKTNKLMTIFFIISLFFIIGYAITFNLIGNSTKLKIFTNIISQISVGYIINFIFYITQVYIPKLKQVEQANICINNRILKILNEMNDLFGYLGKKYLPLYKDGQELSDIQLLQILHSINIYDEIPVINVHRVGQENQHFTVKEWILTKIDFVKYEIDKIFSYYSLYISSELMDVLEKILKSTMHKNICGSLLKVPNGITFDKCSEDIFLKPYYDLMIKLQNISFLNK